MWTRCLYAYVHPRTRELLYLGKADSATVRARFRASDKQPLFRFLERDLELRSFRVLVGAFYLDDDLRLTRQLIADVESLLIKRTKPLGNIAATRSRISRPGLAVHCSGAWPHKKDRFLDRG
jgi:hypothetical protein